MGFSTVPHEPYYMMKKGVFIFFYVNNIVFMFRKDKMGIIKGVMRVLTVGFSAAVAFTTKSLSKFVCKMDKCCPQFNLTALCFV